MSEQNCYHNPEYKQTLSEFYEYLILRKERDEATGIAYCYDVNVFADFFCEHIDANLVGFTITPEYVKQYSDYLKLKVNKKTNKKLGKSTIKRRLIGLYAYWKFLYRNKLIEYPPVSLDDLDIVIRKSKNATVPMNSLKFMELRKELKGELLSMFN